MKPLGESCPKDHMRLLSAGSSPSSAKFESGTRHSCSNVSVVLTSQPCTACDSAQRTKTLWLLTERCRSTLMLESARFCGGCARITKVASARLPSGFLSGQADE